MKKLLLIAAFATVLPFCADASSPVLDDDGSFAVAKAVKLGRGKAYKISGGQGFGSGGYNQQDKMCCAHCSSCDKTSGKCNGCEDGYTLQNNACVEKTCDAHCTNCGKGTCYNCESGYELKYGKCEKKVCGNGTYENNGDCVAICTGVSCNASQGYKAVAYSDSCCCEIEPTTCSAGQYVSGSSCVSCPKGSYGAGGTATSCTSCPSGQTTSSTGATSSSACYSALSCAAGTYNNNGTCAACPSGTYSRGSATACSACSTITTGSNQSVGSYFSATTRNGTTCYTRCTSCSSTGVCTGSNFIENQDSACFSSSGSGNSCQYHSQCPTGYECSGGAGCRVCASGSNLSKTNCNCPAGTLSDGYGNCK